MGGYGTFRLAMLHPEVFSVLYPMSSCCLLDTGEATPEIAKLEGITLEAAARLPFNQKSPLARAAAWSANPAATPLPIDLPSLNGKTRRTVAAKWMANSTLVMLESHTAALKQMKAIQMDVGLQDGLLTTNHDMDEALTNHSVAHTFLTYEGDHNSGVPTRFEKFVLPFFSQHLAFK
jgi:S-formylglutathione hydrolase FrmB